MQAAFTLTDANGNCQCWRVFVSHSHKRTAEYSVSYRVSFHTRERNGYSVTIVFCVTLANAMETPVLPRCFHT